MREWSSIKTRKLVNESVESLSWFNHPDPNLATVKELYNPVKNRKEVWYRQSANHDWQLTDLDPGEHWTESFIGPVHGFVGLVGISLDKTWSINGNPAPAAGNFIATNLVGGGMSVRGLGASADDWVALHTGGQYPVIRYLSPHFHFHGYAPDYTNFYMISGLVGSSNLVTANDVAFTVPDDGVWMELDTDVDTQTRFVTRRDGVQQSTPLGIPIGGLSGSIHFYFSDDYSEVLCLANGYIRARHTLHIPICQLKPYFMTLTRAASPRDRIIQDFEMLWDHI